jgi:hypothetical protein
MHMNAAIHMHIIHIRVLQHLQDEKERERREKQRATLLKCKRIKLHLNRVARR